MADDDHQDDKKGGDDKKPDQPPAPKQRWPWILAGVVVLIFVIVILLIVLLPHRRVRTDDAYVTAHYTMVAPRVTGQIDGVRVDDNQPVRAGDTLATIDPRDLQTALQQAEANRESDRARVDQASAQVARQPSLIAQAQAQLFSARAKLALAQADQRRYANLATSGAGTYQQHQQADANLRDAEATVAQAEAELSSQRHQLDGLKADREAAVA
jgi:membrane fusion protein, multidrug efflux system